jgi:hypothetical protein
MKSTPIHTTASTSPVPPIAAAAVPIANESATLTCGQVKAAKVP